jgi:hypothetical protein
MRYRNCHWLWHAYFDGVRYRDRVGTVDLYGHMTSDWDRYWLRHWDWVRTVYLDGYGMWDGHVLGHLDRDWLWHRDRHLDLAVYGETGDALGFTMRYAG